MTVTRGIAVGRRKPVPVIKTIHYTKITIKVCLVVMALVICVIPGMATASKDNNNDNKSASFIADSTANFTKDNKINGIMPNSNSSIIDPTGAHIANISTITNNNSGDAEAMNNVTSTTTSSPQQLLIPPATVNANIAQMHSGATKKKGQIIIR